MPPNATHLCQPLDVAYFAPMKRQWQKILTDFKQSNRKNAGTVPKDQFPRLLKLLMKMPNQNENFIAGFRKCGIFPLDKTQVLGRLPSNPAQSAQLNSSVSEAFTQHLVDLRTGTGDASAAKRRRRTKMDVVPGRSESRLEDIVEPQEERVTSSTAATLLFSMRKSQSRSFSLILKKSMMTMPGICLIFLTTKHYLEFIHCFIVLWAKLWQINAFSLYRCWR